MSEIMGVREPMPSVEYIDIHKEFQNIGIGTFALSSLHRIFANMGFERMGANEIPREAYPFFASLGYHVNTEIGTNNLIPLQTKEPEEDGSLLDDMIYNNFLEMYVNPDEFLKKTHHAHVRYLNLQCFQHVELGDPSSEKCDICNEGDDGELIGEVFDFKIIEQGTA